MEIQPDSLYDFYSNIHHLVAICQVYEEVGAKEKIDLIRSAGDPDIVLIRPGL